MEAPAAAFRDNPLLKKKGATCLKAAVSRIKFNNILFSYPSGSKPAVEKISFTVKGGKTITLIR